MADPSRVRVVDEEISLVPYYPNEETALPWYQDPDVCRQVDNIDHVYTSERLNAMYKYLSTHTGHAIIYRTAAFWWATCRCKIAASSPS